MSETITVPAVVPSVFHSSAPETESAAVKKRVPASGVRAAGNDDPVPGRMSRTSAVPVAVPSVFHTSLPVMAPATKKVIGPTAVKLPGVDDAPVVLRSATRDAAAATAITSMGITGEALRLGLDPFSRKQSPREIPLR